MYVQDGSLVDLLEQLQRDKAHLPVQDVLSIFFQVLHERTTHIVIPIAQSQQAITSSGTMSLHT